MLSMSISSQGVKLFKEIYKDYQVSEDGVVLSKRGKPLKTFDNGRGYLIVSLMVNGKPKVKAIHRLVAEAWIPNPDNLPEVDHIDGNKLNNHKSNLRWITRSGNIAHAFKLEKRTAKGEKNSRCKTTEKEVREICSLIQYGFSSAKIRDMGYSYILVQSIKRKSNWKYISDEYDFTQGSEASRKA